MAERKAAVRGKRFRFEWVALKSLWASDYNPRLMPDNEMESLKKSMLEFGCCQPLVVNKSGTIIGGHQRFTAAKALGWKEIPIIRVDVSKQEEKLLNLALNRIHGEWDEDKLSELLAELSKADDLDVLLSGFDENEIEGYLRGTVDLQEEEKPDVKFSEYLDETNNYVVLVFRNDIDWLSALTHFDIKTVKSRNARGKELGKGTGRVLDGAEYLRRVSDANL